jgi:hypothetical protein
MRGNRYRCAHWHHKPFIPALRPAFAGLRPYPSIQLKGKTTQWRLAYAYKPVSPSSHGRGIAAIRGTSTTRRQASRGPPDACFAVTGG